MPEVVRIGDIEKGHVWREKRNPRIVRILGFEQDYEWRFRDGRRVRVVVNSWRVIIQTIPQPGRRQTMPSVMEIEPFLKRFEKQS